MRITGFLSLAVVLVATLSACEATDGIGPATEEFAADALDAEITAASYADATNPRGGEGGGSALFDRLAAEIPGFGGLYRGGRCNVVVVLTDMAQQEHAVRVVYEAISSLVGRPCATHLTVTAVEGDFTYIQLQRWLSNARPLLEIDGVLGIHVSYPDNRLVITVRSRNVAIMVIEELPRLDIPADAVLFQLGYTGGGRSR